MIREQRMTRNKTLLNKNTNGCVQTLFASYWLSQVMQDYESFNNDFIAFEIELVNEIIVSLILLRSVD